MFRYSHHTGVVLKSVSFYSIYHLLLADLSDCRDLLDLPLSGDFRLDALTGVFVRYLGGAPKNRYSTLDFDTFPTHCNRSP